MSTYVLAPSPQNVYFLCLIKEQARTCSPVLARCTQLYECSRQCSRPVLAQCSMGFGPNPKINGLIQHTFKLNIFFFGKIHSNTF